MIKPLFRYAGGKNKMIKQYAVSPTIPQHHSRYYEPFLGGGSMLLWQYKNNKNLKEIVINDISDELISIYIAIKANPTTFIAGVQDLQTGLLAAKDKKEYYYSQRDKYSQAESPALLYFLMLNCFNGVWQTKASTGRFYSPYGCHKPMDIENIKQWHILLQRCTISNTDWRNIEYLSDAFIFCDPPYLISNTDYGDGFTKNDHIDLIAFCNRQRAVGNVAWYCGRIVDDFYDIYRQNLTIAKYPYTYTAGRRATVNGKKQAKKTIEILLY